MTVGDAEIRTICHSAVTQMHTATVIALGGICHAICVLEYKGVHLSVKFIPVICLITARQIQVKADKGVGLFLLDHLKSGDGIKAQSASRTKVRYTADDKLFYRFIKHCDQLLCMLQIYLPMPRKKALKFHSHFASPSSLI